MQPPRPRCPSGPPRRTSRAGRVHSPSRAACSASCCPLKRGSVTAAGSPIGGRRTAPADEGGQPVLPQHNRDELVRDQGDAHTRRKRDEGEPLGEVSEIALERQWIALYGGEPGRRYAPDQAGHTIDRDAGDGPPERVRAERSLSQDSAYHS